MAGKKGFKAEPMLQEASNSQESDTFGSLDHLPEAGQVSSHMPETSSQELPLEVDAIGLQGQGQLSTDVPDEASLEGNFPAVNIAPSGRVSPPNKKGKGSSTAAKGGKAVAKDPKDPKSKDDKDVKDEDKSGKKGGKNANAPPMEAEVDAADVLLSLSMSAARTGTRSGKNPTEAVPPGQPARKRYLHCFPRALAVFCPESHTFFALRRAGPRQTGRILRRLQLWMRPLQPVHLPPQPLLQPLLFLPALRRLLQLQLCLYLLLFLFLFLFLLLLPSQGRQHVPRNKQTML